MMTDDEPRILRRIEYIPHDATVAEMVDWCMQRGLDPEVVKLSGGHVKWESPETDAERARREEYAEKAAARHDQWERETYERLKIRFEGEQ